MDMDVSIGQAIRRLRTAKGMTQKLLADKSNISLSALQRYETDERCPSVEIIRKVAEALEVDYWEIIGFNPIDLGTTIMDYEDAQEKLRIILSEDEFAMLRAYQAADDRAREDALLLLKEHKK